MAASRSSITTLLLLLVAVALSYGILPISAKTSVARQLREQVDFVDAAALSESATSSSSSSALDHKSSAPGEAANASETEHSAASTASEPKHEGPTMMSFVGPAAAGVLAILLIGAVIAFKKRMNK